MTRAVALQTQQQMGQQRAMLEESPTDIILQSLLVDDSDLKRILKGEIHEAIQELSQMVLDASAMQRIDNPLAFKILGVCKQVNVQLAKYQKILPYLMLLSPLMRLTNITAKQARILKLRITVMVHRDLLDIDEDELELTDINFYESLKLLCFNAVDDSVMGWKANVVTEQKKVIETRLVENRQRKRKWGIF